MCDYKYDVFISYSRKDYVDEGQVIPGNMLSKIKEAFKANSISYWFDEEGIYSGDEFASVLTGAIRNSRIFLFVSSVNSNQSRWTSNEISTALVFGKPVIPFRLDDSPYNDSVMMKIISYDYIECKDEKKAIEKLIRAVKHHLPEIPGLSKSRWRNIAVPEGARGTIIGFIVGDEVQEQKFFCEDTHKTSCEDTHKSSCNDTMDDQPLVNPEIKKRGSFSLNARYKGCALSMMVALGLLALIGFFPFMEIHESNQQIAQAGNEEDLICDAPSPALPPPTSYSPAFPPQKSHPAKPSSPKQDSSNSSQKSDNSLVAEC